MEKIWVLTVEERDAVNTELYRGRENAVKCVIEDLADRYHFDTDEPYITEQELMEKQQTAKKELDSVGWWQDDDVTYYIDEKQVQD